MTSPSGMMSLPISYLREMIANSSSFRTWTGTADVTEAKTRIHVSRTPESATKPLAVIGFASDWSRRQEEQGVFFQENGLELMFQASFSSSDSEIDSAYEFMNNVGAVMTDLEESVGTAGFLNMVEWSIEEGPERPEINEEQTAGYTYTVILRITYDGT